MKTVNKPWGKYEQLTLNEKTSVKIITVEPNKRLSLQSHKYRTENWYCLEGGGVVTINGKDYPFSIGDLIRIPKKAKHRVKCVSGTRLQFLEVSYGKFDEKDITRYEDDYGRTKNKK